MPLPSSSPTRFPKCGIESPRRSRRHQGVTLAHCGHGLIQARPGAVGAGQTLVHVNAIRCDAELGECLPLLAF